jgi:hypothetical protein
MKTLEIVEVAEGQACAAEACIEINSKKLYLHLILGDKVATVIMPRETIGDYKTWTVRTNSE